MPRPSSASTVGRTRCARSSCPTSASRSSSPAVATELTDHITDEATKQGVEQLYATTAIRADDIAEVIAFAVGRPRHVALNEILVRPAGQA
jgi:NADP-dependent 3-hydroxy acid dehydrogenase YdfG